MIYNIAEHRIVFLKAQLLFSPLYPLSPALILAYTLIFLYT